MFFDICDGGKRNLFLNKIIKFIRRFVGERNYGNVKFQKRDI